MLLSILQSSAWRLFRDAGRGLRPLCSGNPFQRYKTANVVGQVLQANLGARPHDADRAHHPATLVNLIAYTNRGRVYELQGRLRSGYRGT